MSFSFTDSNLTAQPNTLASTTISTSTTSTPTPTLLAQAEQSSPLVSFLPIVFILLIFYFLLIRPQSKKQKLLDKKRKMMEKGDKIITTSGIYAKIIDINHEKDLVVVTLDGQVKMEITVNAVGEVVITEEVFKKRQEKSK